VPEVRVGREDWIAAGVALLAQGISPAEMEVAGLCAAMTRPVTKGSFYWRFRSGRLAEFRLELIGRWRQQHAVTGHAVRAVRDPVDRLRVLRDAAAANGPADAAMRRWAAAPPPGPDADPAEADVHRQVAAAVAEISRATAEHIAEALAELGFGGHEAAVLAATLAGAFAGSGPAAPVAAPTDPEAFEVLLGVLRRAAGPAGRPVVQVIAGDADEVILVLAARSLSAAQRRELARAAQLAAGQRARPGGSATGT
jgi:AcrR family transcriptional regulator